MIFRNKFIPQFEPIRRLKDAWSVFKTIRKGNLGPGKICLQLEEEIKKLTGAKYCFTTTSGTVALIMAIESLNLPKGSTILFPSYTFLAGCNAARFMGYKIKLVDINPVTLCIDPRQLKKKMNKNVSCVIFVNHNAYFKNDILEAQSICRQHNIPMIEDSCQSIGVVNAGRTGNVGVFSFSVPKLVSGGQGGAVITNNDKIAERLAQIRDHGDNWRKDRYHSFVGVNFRYNDIQASYVLSQLKDIKILLEKRYSLCHYYYSNGIDPIGFDRFYSTDCTPWMVLYRSEKSIQIIDRLKENGIEAVRYYLPISYNKPYHTKAKFPEAQKAFEYLVYLPSSLNLTKKEIGKICTIIKEVEEETTEISGSSCVGNETNSINVTYSFDVSCVDPQRG